ncbi:MAG: FixH family protein [Sulfurimonas sp.]|nr:FixH family protein [Sulfurimonas sp.]
MKILAIILGAILAFSSLDAAPFVKNIEFKTTKVHMSSQKPLSVGFNTLVLNVTQKSKAPSGAKVSVKIFMPAMPGMPAMKSTAQAKDLGNGKYEVKVNIPMSGTWQVHIFITPTEGKKSRVKTSINI